VDIADFDYDLPPEAIAQEPAAERDASRLLVLDRGAAAPTHHLFHDLPALLEPGDLLVLNRSRVFPARLLGRRAGGGAAEVLLLRPLPAAQGPPPSAHPEQRWTAMVRPGRRLRRGDVIEVAAELEVHVETDASGPDGARPVVLRAHGVTVPAAIERHGHMPLPPYIRRADTAADRERYQTVYAREAGSVAAPTAGLHFTEPLFERLAARGVAWTEIVLHVGPGTFQPVRAERVEEHRLPAEPFVVPEAAAAAVAAARARGGRVLAVGTTAVRALESAVGEDGLVRAGAGETDLVIVPGHRFRVVQALLTNFHLPRSSLLLLVCAFAGRERVMDAYAEALARGYRFYSYGDAMLVRGKG
jgi:S-adenosylmethionine:tRNA ribosyltransferase-isomerase